LRCTLSLLFTHTPSTYSHTLPLPAALPIYLPPDGILAVEMRRPVEHDKELAVAAVRMRRTRHGAGAFQMRFAGKLRRELLARPRSEEHTSELQSREKLVCRPLLEKKKTYD